MAGRAGGARRTPDGSGRRTARGARRRGRDRRRPAVTRAPSHVRAPGLKCVTGAAARTLRERAAGT
ncbi:hypothetical protein D7193_01650 [Micromonospora costi]|uniref:Uncharacterized protein n=1 Tax=Micromonospora costi TaxID=1530042 RepID=A0A3B0ACK0_9ACTN|nr:hypothetical protein D7193_01650 [Micromonospora costi]